MDKLLRDKTVAGLEPGSAAETAGLREGQRVLGFSRIVPGDTSLPIDVTVQDFSGTHTVTFYPQGPPVAVPQYVPIKGADKAQARAWFGLPPASP